LERAQFQTAKQGPCSTQISRHSAPVRKQ
jgi:hypothetical protein